MSTSITIAKLYCKDDRPSSEYHVVIDIDRIKDASHIFRRALCSVLD